jgi:hypothetical protein
MLKPRTIQAVRYAGHAPECDDPNQEGNHEGHSSPPAQPRRAGCAALQLIHLLVSLRRWSRNSNRTVEAFVVVVCQTKNRHWKFEFTSLHHPVRQFLRLSENGKELPQRSPSDVSLKRLLTNTGNLACLTGARSNGEARRRASEVSVSR